MWVFRVRATSSPPGDTTIAVLKPSPSAASDRSYSEAWTSRPNSAAAADANSIVGPSSRLSAMSAGVPCGRVSAG
jgi:hypothetical protein